MNLPAFVSLAGLLCYGGLTFVVLRRGLRDTGAVLRLFVGYLALMVVYQGSALAVSLARSEAVALHWYAIMSALLLGQFVVYSTFVRAFFHIRGHRYVIWVGLAMWALCSLLAASHLEGFIVGVYWNDTTHFYLPIFGDLLAIYAVPNYSFLAYAIVLLYTGYRQAGSALERQRIRYLFLGLSVIGLGTVTNLIPPLKPYPFDMLTNILNALLIAYAILRYQLLDIRVVIRKGLVYSVPTVTIGIGYFLVLSLSFNVLDVARGYQFFVLSLVLAAATAIVVQPLRDKLQSTVDRFFFREKYDSGLMLQRLSRTAASVLDLDRLAVMIVDDITQTLHSAVTAFFIKQGETGQFVLRAHRGLEAAPQDRFLLRNDHPIATWLLRHQTSLTRPQVNSSPEFMGLWTTERQALEDMQAELFVPLLVRDDLIGILVLGPRLSDLPYAPDDQRTLTTLANQTAIAVENARLYSLEQAKVKMTSTLLDVARVVSSTLNLDELLQQIAQRAADICGFDRCNLFLKDRGQDRLRLLASGFAAERMPSLPSPSSQQAPGLEQVESNSLLKRIMQERRPVIIDRDGISKLPATWSETVDTEGVLIVPLVSKDRAIGLMTLDHLQGARRIGKDQMDLAATIASHASVAIENAWLYQETVTEKERTATIVERALAGIALVNPDLKIVSINDAVEAITGYDTRLAQGQDLSVVFGPGITAESGLLKRAMRTGKPVGPAETTLTSAAGERDVLLGVTPLPDGYLLSMSDVTPLKELNRLKSDIIANVSHEFRTPLSVIKGYAELLADEIHADDPTIRARYLEIISSATDRLTAMVSDLLDLARVEAEQGSITMEPVSIETLIEDSIGLVGFQAQERDVKIEVNVATDLPEMLGNRELLVTLIRNLLSNAVKFSYPGGRVQVRATQQGDSIELQVTNQGIGLAAEDMPRLFDKFYRSAAAKRAGIQGTGLGLVLVKHAADKHRGEITVSCDPEAGTRFCVRLPIAEAPNRLWGEPSPEGSAPSNGVWRTEKAGVSGT